MKKIFFIFFFVILLINLNTYEYKSINYELKKIEITYFRKIFNFIQRYYDTKKFIHATFKNIEKHNDIEKSYIVFNWIANNIKLDDDNTIDDHHINIIKRRKGAKDQRALIFSMILNYLKIDSFYKCNKKNTICLAFAKQSNDNWFFFDINNWNTSDLINYRSKNLFSKNINISFDFALRDAYIDIFNSLDYDLNKELYKNTSYIQTPLKRLIYYINEKK